jgi:hypothetical protein
MTTYDLFDLIKLEHGQYITDDLEITQADIVTILQNHVLTTVGKYRPVRRVLNIYVPNAPYTFAAGNDPLTGAPFAPDWVSDVGIVMTSQPNTITAVIPQMFRQENRSRLWLYDKPYLFTFMFGQLSVQACFYPYLQETIIDSVHPDAYEIKYLDDNAIEMLVDLTAGHLLRSVGKARRGVNFADYPIVTDAATLAQEGEAIIENTMGKLQQKSSWWLAV